MNISIIIVNWNTKDMLVNCLESIYRTQKSAFEVWVVDNGSADGSVEAVKAMFPQARLIENQENLGFAKANNQALKLASGSYLVLLNSDCVLGPGSLDTMIKFMSGHKDVAICSPQLLNEDSTRQNSIANIPTLSTELLNKSLLRRLFPGKYPGKERIIDEPFQVESVIGACMVVRKEAIEDCGLLDEDYFLFLEETDWCKRVREKGWKVVFHPGGEVFHLQGASARKSIVRARIEYWKSRYVFFRKHRGVAARFFLRSALFLRLTINFFANIFYNIITLFLSGRAREKLKLNSALIVWHVLGCPKSWGLKGAGPGKGLTEGSEKGLEDGSGKRFEGGV